jgi:phosphotransferase system  glucose/maltose/N-acetylglucosamine-specific IIC component
MKSDIFWDLLRLNGIFVGILIASIIAVFSHYSLWYLAMTIVCLVSIIYNSTIYYLSIKQDDKEIEKIKKDLSL